MNGKIYTYKALLLIALTILIFNAVIAQAPQKISYQAVIRNSNNDLIKNKQVGMRIKIQKFVFAIPTPYYVTFYGETQTPTTNANGLVSIEIGAGTVIEGDFSAIDWSDGPYLIRTEIDPDGGTNYTINGTSSILSVPYALYAKYAENTKTYKVGDFAHGGIVFWVDETGQHGLVCAKEDQSTGVRWYAGTNGNTQAKGDGPYAGKANTSIIIAAHAAIGDDGNTYAARICNELKITEGGKTYGDWYLPSYEELILMYQNKSIINNTAIANGGSSFVIEPSKFYWSSTENDNDSALGKNFGTGTAGPGSKNNVSWVVRAVRAF